MLPLATSTWDASEYAAIQRVVESGQFTMGKEVRGFEEAFAEAFDSRYAVMVNSGSSANLLAVAALFFTSPPKLHAGMTVVVPAVSWPTTYYPLTQYGLKLKFVDIDAYTLNFDLDALEKALTPEVAAIFAVNILGNPNDYDRIGRMISGRNITLLEDNCEAMGATFGGRFTGTFGMIGTFSTYFSHHISTMEGGLCVTDDEEVYHLLLSLRSHGWTRNLPTPNKLVESDPRGRFYDLFRFILPGYNVRPLELSGAIGIEQLKKLPGLVEMRRANAAYAKELFAEFDDITMQSETGESSWFGFALACRGKAIGKRDVLIEALGDAGVQTRPIVAGNFAKNPVIAFMPHVETPVLPNADTIDLNGFYIGNHHYDLRSELRGVRDVFRTTLR